MWFSECGDGTPCDISAPTKTTDNDTIQYYNCTGTNNIPNAQAGGFCNTSNDCVNSLPCQNSICVG